MYTLIGRLGGSVIEIPVRAARRFLHRLGDYQVEHGRRVRISPGDQFLSDARLALDSVVDDEPEALLDSNARWVVLHRSWETELGPSLGNLGPASPAIMRRSRDTVQMMERLARRIYRDLTAAWGPPALENEMLAVWDLQRVR
jgi:hypothetical protein